MNQVNQVNSPKLSYRAEIDGLRAVAVVSVILYHAQMVLFGRDWFEGGFIGVDVFFVISGYLITRIILSELESKGSFSFLNFYERRARRILPMLFVVIFVSVPYAWQKLLPSDFVEYAESILASLFFGSNFFFYFSTTEYGADSALLKPFLHTWSLGVEEQFYLVFPILAIIAFKYFRKHFLTILVVLSLLSLQFAELMEVRNSDLNFYLPFSRFWELTVGSMLAYRELYYKPSNEGFVSKSLPMIGLYLIAYSILFFDGKTPHPSFHTLIPIIGVALIIGFASKDELVGKVLGSKPFVWIGLISYSAYLWHFPIFAFSRMGKESTTYDKFEWIALTFLLSLLSFFVIERPFRKKSLNGKKFLTVLASSTVLVSFLMALIILTFDYRNIEENSRFHPKSILDKGAFLEAWRDQAMAERLTTNFELNGKKKVLIVGNSHGIDFFRALQSSSLYENVDFGLISQNRNTDNYQVRCFYEYLVKQKTTCGKKNVEFTDVKEKFESAEYIVLKTRWEEQDLEVLQRLISLLIASHKKVVVVGNAFEQKEILRQFILREGDFPNPTDLEELKRSVFATASHSKINAIDTKLREISQKMNVPFISAKELYCDYEIKECDIFTPKGFLIVWDYGHLTVEGSKYIGEVIASRNWMKSLLN